jgi:hypothetical protein
MKIASVFALSTLVVVSAAACSSSPEQDKGLEGTGTTGAASAPDTNERGDKYPTDNIGTNPRRGATPGNRIQNFKFLGYPGGDKAQGLKPVSLAQYYDPSGEKYKLIHIQVSGLWCPPCRAEAEMVAPMGQVLADRKVVWLMGITEGPTPGIAATTADMNKWIDQFKAPYTHFLDPANQNLGAFYDRAAIPWNANISAKTMEILSSTTGGPVDEQALLRDLDKWLAQVD